MNSTQINQVATMLSHGDHDGLRALQLSKYSIRTFVVPIVRKHLNEIPPARVKGLTSNWAGKQQMSRYAS